MPIYRIVRPNIGGDSVIRGIKVPTRLDPKHPRVERPEEGRSLQLSDGSTGNNAESLRRARILKSHRILAWINNPEEYILGPGITTKRHPSLY